MTAVRYCVTLLCCSGFLSRLVLSPYLGDECRVFYLSPVSTASTDMAVVVVVVVAVVGVEMAVEVMVVVKAGQDNDDNLGGDDDL